MDLKTIQALDDLITSMRIKGAKWKNTLNT